MHVSVSAYMVMASWVSCKSNSCTVWSIKSLYDPWIAVNMWSLSTNCLILQTLLTILSMSVLSTTLIQCSVATNIYMELVVGGPLYLFFLKKKKSSLVFNTSQGAMQYQPQAMSREFSVQIYLWAKMLGHESWWQNPPVSKKKRESQMIKKKGCKNFS